MRSSTGRAGAALTRREWFTLAAAGFGGSLLPGLGRTMAMARADEKPTETVGRIWAIGSQMRGVGRELTGVFAIDPKDGSWRKVADLPDDPGLHFWSARFSPDGRVVAFPRPGPPAVRGIWLLDLEEDAKPRRILDQRGLPSWSGDGRRLVVGTMRMGRDWARTGFQAWQIDADGSNPKRLPLAENDLVLDWSADGRWLLVASSRDLAKAETAYTYWPVYVMRPDGSEARRVIDEAPPANPAAAPVIRTCRFSPDGRRVVYTVPDFSSRGSAAWVVGRDGSGRRRLAPDGLTSYYVACCSPDGSRLALRALDFERGQDGKLAPVGAEHLVFMDYDGGHRRRIDLPTFPLHIIDWR